MWAWQGGVAERECLFAFLSPHLSLSLQNIRHIDCLSKFMTLFGGSPPILIGTLRPLSRGQSGWIFHSYLLRALVGLFTRHHVCCASMFGTYVVYLEQLLYVHVFIHILFSQPAEKILVLWNPHFFRSVFWAFISTAQGVFKPNIFSYFVKRTSSLQHTPGSHL
jgi:hypothetical protein